jgi:hypothetical protein
MSIRSDLPNASTGAGTSHNHSLQNVGPGNGPLNMVVASSARQTPGMYTAFLPATQLEDNISLQGLLASAYCQDPPPFPPSSSCGCLYYMYVSSPASSSLPIFFNPVAPGRVGWKVAAIVRTDSRMVNGPGAVKKTTTRNLMLYNFQQL